MIGQPGSSFWISSVTRDGSCGTLLKRAGPALKGINASTLSRFFKMRSLVSLFTLARRVDSGKANLGYSMLVKTEVVGSKTNSSLFLGMGCVLR